MTDLLASFRKSSSAGGSTTGAAGGGSVTLPTGDGTPPPAVEEYKAFGTKDHVHRLRIRSASEPVNAPGYNILLNVVYDGQQGTHFILVYSVLMVLVRGKNLQKLVYAIENEMADYIQQYDPKKWPKPADGSAAFIETIELQMAEGGRPVEEKNE